ncbi:immunoglobulin-like domain-containing protein [Algibacillus agarilyticus]|uniref:immunoglobulin-like domain-containing protein n=1 Tax=Algibacillus agarilyticus TaxID=2234133 RepID=UPI0018E524E6|nr:immunoglobulin-like domain-containing protein [Algibacillus agarilyticus]
MKLTNLSLPYAFKKTALLISTASLVACGGGGDNTNNDVDVTPDTQAPVITLTGDKVVTHNFGEAYNDLGATSIDNVDGAVTVTHNANTTVKINEAGSYTITYTATDAANNTSSLTRTVNISEPVIVDTTPPVITLKGDAVVEHDLADNYTDLGASAIDDIDGTVTVTNNMATVVDLNKVGHYTLTYTATDAAGNSSTLTRDINVFSTAVVNDWDGMPVPAEKFDGTVSWQLVEDLSDSFNYETPYGSNKGVEFNAKWEDGYINAWPGFGNTIWTPNNSRVTAGNLELKATSLDASKNTNNFSAIHARTSIIYPAYIETRVKIMNSVMANAVWMLSDNSAEEIDIVEAYGSSYSESKGASREWFAQRMHLSHHTFDKSVKPNKDYQPSTESGTYYQLPQVPSYWRDDFYTVGVYWRDPFHLEYYINGELVRTVSGAAIIDPHEYLKGNGLSSPETILFSGAAQGWQVAGGVWPTVNELSVEADNVFKIDWIRTYKRIGGTPYVAPK